jgi:hypothetical protein
MTSGVVSCEFVPMGKRDGIEMDHTKVDRKSILFFSPVIKTTFPLLFFEIFKKNYHFIFCEEITKTNVTIFC